MVFHEKYETISNILYVKDKGDRVNYIIKMAWQHLKWNKWISILMIIEITLGIGVLVYSLNLYSSLLNEEKERKQQRYDWCLEITSSDAVASIGNPALTFETQKG